MPTVSAITPGSHRTRSAIPRKPPEAGSEVALFVTCLVDQVTPSVGRAATRLLEAAGYRVAFPMDQTCCGQPAYSAGETGAAAKLALQTLHTLRGYPAVVLPSGSCAAMLRHSYERLTGRAEATELTQKTWELGELLALNPPTFAKERSGGRQVTVHDSCHGLRELGLGRDTRRLLEDSGYKIVEARSGEICCGFGGIFTALLPELSCAMADSKLADAASAADTLTGGDVACLLHLEARRLLNGPSGVTIRHYAELLAEALPPEDDSA